MDGPVGFLRRENIIPLPDGPGQNFRRGVADGKGLLHRPENGGVVEPRGEGIDGKHPAGGNRLGVGGLEYRIRHAVGGIVPGKGAIENVFSAVFQIVLGVPGIKEGQIQPPGGVRRLDPGQIQTLTDVGGAGGVHDHGPEAGGLVRLQLADGDALRPILVASGEMANEVLQREDIQGGKELCLCRADAL